MAHVPVRLTESPSGSLGRTSERPITARGERSGNARRTCGGAGRIRLTNPEGEGQGSPDPGSRPQSPLGLSISENSGAEVEPTLEALNRVELVCGFLADDGDGCRRRHHCHAWPAVSHRDPHPVRDRTEPLHGLVAVRPDVLRPMERRARARGAICEPWFSSLASNRPAAAPMVARHDRHPLDHILPVEEGEDPVAVHHGHPARLATPKQIGPAHPHQCFQIRTAKQPPLARLPLRRSDPISVSSPLHAVAGGAGSSTCRLQAHSDGVVEDRRASRGPVERKRDFAIATRRGVSQVQHLAPNPPLSGRHPVPVESHAAPRERFGRPAVAPPNLPAVRLSPGQHLFASPEILYSRPAHGQRVDRFCEGSASLGGGDGAERVSLPRQMCLNRLGDGYGLDQQDEAERMPRPVTARDRPARSITLVAARRLRMRSVVAHAPAMASGRTCTMIRSSPG